MCFISRCSFYSTPPLFRIPKHTFQLLGATCLFLSSKFKAIEHIGSRKLRGYTDDSITEQELKVTIHPFIIE